MNTSNHPKYYTCLLILCLLFTFPLYSHPQDFLARKIPKRETRAVWLTTLDGLDWPSCKALSVSGIEKQKHELTAILDSLQRVNINTVLFQARIRGTVVYPSSIEPWDACLTGVPGRNPGYDPLAFAIKECHRRGMEIQAWVVAIPLGGWNSPGCKSLRNKHTGIVIRHRGQGYIDPSRPASAQYIAGLCSEIASRYDIDGIHLDYIRYPETMRGVNHATARQNITRIVEVVRDRVKAIKPWLKLSCAVIGKRDDLARTHSYGWNAFDAGRQDVETWMRRGLVDQLYPMMYFRGDQFYPFLLDWKENDYNCEIIPGLGIYMLSPHEGHWPTEEIERQMLVSRSLGMGFALFREKFLRNYAKPIYSFMKEFSPYPSFVPPTHKDSIAIAAPATINVERTGNYAVVTWKDCTLSGLRHNVYVSNTYPVDTDNAQNLLVMKVEGNRIAAKVQDDMYFAVTAIDRFGRESEATQQDIPAYTHTNEKPGIPLIDVVAGENVMMPEPFNRQSTDAVIIKNIVGTDVGVRPCIGGLFATKGLPYGFYAVYSLNQKGIMHRMFFLKIIPKKQVKMF